jgi:hypothetical protein
MTGVIRGGRVPGQVYVINLVRRWIWSILGFGKIPRPRDEDDFGAPYEGPSTRYASAIRT